MPPSDVTEPIPLRLEVDPGIEVVLHDFGGDGEPLLFCHANGFHGRVWGPLVAHLRHRRCLALDFRGFGDSTAPTETAYDWQQLGDDVLAAVDLTGMRGGDAVGHSMGGAALFLAELTRPGTFGRLFVYEPIVPPPDRGEGDSAMADLARRRRTEFASYQEAIDRYVTKVTLGALDPDCLEAYVRHGFSEGPDGVITLKASPEHEARHYEAAVRTTLYGRLEEIGGAVTVATGPEGFPAMLAPIVAERIPGAELLRFDDLGHFGPLEDPARMAAAIATALD